MNILASQVGIDVDRRFLVVSVDCAKPFKLANSAVAITENLHRIPPGSQIHMEASGGYERVAKRVFLEEGFDVHVHNPLKTRRLSDALASSAKTDPIDSVNLARNGHLLPQAPCKSLERQDLADVSRVIEEMRAVIGQWKTMLAKPDIASTAKEAYKMAIETLKKQADQLESKFKHLVQNSSCAKRYELCIGIRGVGPVTARIMVSELPEDFLDRTAEQIASYAGVAPIDDSSGQRAGAARTKRGNYRLKKALYMPALWAVQKESWAKDAYTRLRSKGKSHRTAMVAVMRRILVRIVAVLQRGSAWQAEPQKT